MSKEFITPQEKEDLKKCKSVADMLTYLNDNFDLNVVPGLLDRTLLVSGLDKALQLIKPLRKAGSGKKRIFKS